MKQYHRITLFLFLKWIQEKEEVRKYSKIINSSVDSTIGKANGFINKVPFPKFYLTYINYTWKK